MLQHLTIDNYTIIDHLSVAFDEGFTVITGETGAGKSILLGALSLVLGQRADTGVLRDKTKKSVVEAEFHISGYGLQEFFLSHDLDYDDFCLLRREITPQEKSRAFINDTPVSLSILRELAERLVDIHSQYGNLLLKNKHFQLQIIDQYAHLQEQTASYRNAFGEYISLQQELRLLMEKSGLSDTDYLDFLGKELDEARLREGEQQSLEDELDSLNHAEEIKQKLFASSQQLADGDDNILNALQNIQHQIQQASRHRASLRELGERLDSLCIELEDVSSEIEQEQEKISYSPQRADEVRERLDFLYGLQQKHHVNDEKGLLEKQDEIRQKLLDADRFAEKKEELLQRISEKEKELEIQAAELHRKRQSAIPDMQQALLLQLKRMNMSHARAAIHLEQTTIGENGTDEARFLFSANAGTELADLSRIASGGEISRIMLAVKALISQKNILPTILFDEIDNGVSGEVSAKMADVMRDVARYSQVMVISHQAQIAAKAHHHYQVYKETSDDQTLSHIRRLDNAESIREIARMLGNGTLTEASLLMARSLQEKPCDADSRKEE